MFPGDESRASKDEELPEPMEPFNTLSTKASPFAREIFGDWNNGFTLILFYTLSFLVLWLLSHPLEKLFLRLVYRGNSAAVDDRARMIRKAVHMPVRIIFSLAVVHALSLAISFPEEFRPLLNQFFRITVIVFGAWILRRIVSGSTSLMEENLGSRGDDWKVRESRTRLIVFRRVSTFVIVVLSTGLILEGFDVVREVGMSILASAGIAGVVLGFAAQKSIASLISGMQLALTQPVRIGDTVIVDGQWGKVEEIGLTYVVVRIWDLRRLVVPIQKFLDEPFENWTRASTRINGSIFLYVDYRTPVDLLRAKLQEIVEQSPHWDGETCTLVVTDATEKSMQVRTVVSAEEASSLWDLRCEVREKMIAFLQNYKNGAFLPRERFEESDGKKPPGRKRNTRP